MIRYNELTKIFHDGEKDLRIIDHASFDFPTSGTVAIVGASGVGKSTLLLLLGALDSPSSGEIFIGDQEIGKLSSDALAAIRRDKIGFVFQFNQLLSDFTAIENVAMPLLLRGQGEKESMTLAEQALVSLGLEERVHHRPKALSGGEQQRVAIARAIVGRPPVILADEPTGSLDPETAKIVEGQLVSVVRELNGLLIVVTHNYSLAKSMDVVLEMKPGGQLIQGGRL